MKVDFEIEVNRNNTGSLKYDGREIFNKSEDQIPLWIADMDLLTPKCVNEAIERRMKHPIYGYNYAPDSYYNSIISWMKNRHNYEITREMICPFPGVVPAIALLYQAFLSRGDSVLILEPGYNPFRSMAENNGYHIVSSALIYKDNTYTIDFEDMEAKIVSNKIKVFVLCSPHNPVGRVWKHEELTMIADICVKHNVVVISDEIHSDLVFHPNKHIPLPLISNEIANLSVVCTAPTKTFNLAGMKVSNIIIQNKVLREKFQEQCERLDLVSLHTFSYVVCESVYTEAESWLEQLIEHLSLNFELLEDCISKYESVKLIKPEATYLAWIDVTDLGYDTDTLKERFLDNHLWVEFQDDFEKNGKRQFVRINIAISRKKLKVVLKHLENIFKKGEK